MPYPFLRADEVRGERPVRAEPGVLVVFASGARHFYPGGTEAAAVFLAKATLPADLWGDPRNQVEYGTRVNGRWVGQRVIRKSTLRADKEE